MFENRVQISRLSGVDGLVGDAGNLELDACADELEASDNV